MRNAIMKGIVSSKRENNDFKRELNLLQKNNRQFADNIFKEALSKGDKITIDTFQQINQMLVSQRSFKEKYMLYSGAQLYQDQNQLV